MRSVEKIKNIRDKTVLVRVDFNVPIKNGKVEDDFRIQKALPTIKFLQKKGAKIILISHHSTTDQSLDVVAKALNKYIKVKFIRDIVGEKSKKAVETLGAGEVILLENLRNDSGEKEGNRVFAVSLARHGDIYVNECFPVDHRTDASIELLPKLLPAYAGFQLSLEVEHLSRAFKNPKHPFLFILGGAKFSTKLPLIEKYLKLADRVFIGGALANDVLKGRGYEVGQSLVDSSNHDISKVLKNKKLILPTDVVVVAGDMLINKNVNEVKKNESIIDIGSETVKSLAPLIKESKFILWNGPLGKYESGGGVSTKEVLKLIAGSTAESIIGGGDTVAIISEMGIGTKFSFVSTGGGATLDFLANGTLPGIKALE